MQYSNNDKNSFYFGEIVAIQSEYPTSGNVVTVELVRRPSISFAVNRSDLIQKPVGEMTLGEFLAIEETVSRLAAQLKATKNIQAVQWGNHNKYDCIGTMKINLGALKRQIEKLEKQL